MLSSEQLRKSTLKIIFKVIKIVPVFGQIDNITKILTRLQEQGAR